NFQHKCGYCGWLFRFTTNFTDHECFKNYIEDVDRINIDENYVVTIVENNPTVVGKENLNELLIEAVRSKRGLYDFRHVPASERTIHCVKMHYGWKFQIYYEDPSVQKKLRLDGNIYEIIT
ncbi:uncharacterized protein LOC143903154, partial [Temnothorax americanus]|uniref:uncharacterized protein LOC143903154 n=1 Tax=Temnothorax americanus TaxID=1964332 RepID=UPI0040684569